MRAPRAARRLALAGLLLLTAGCADEVAGSSSDADRSPDPVPSSTTTSSTTTSTPPARIDIVATDYEWSGLPDELPAGTYPMSFVNEGAEVHEISIFRNPEDLPLDELFALGPEGMEEVVEPVGMLISAPGTPAEEEVEITLTPGEYEVVCFVPAASDGRPHFDHGMHRTLTVR